LLVGKHLIFQESPQSTCYLLELLAGAHRANPWRSLTALVAQLHYQLQGGLNCLANRQAVLLQGGPVNRSFLVVVSEAKQLLLQAQQLCSEFSAGAAWWAAGCMSRSAS
jgi:hypothetical protein